MGKRILIGEQAREAMMKGVDLVTDIVQSTLGPNGKLVAIGKMYQLPYLTKDGVTVAKEIEAENPEEQMGVDLIVNSPIKTNDTVGDGTTTSTILTRAMATLGMTDEYISERTNMESFKKGMLECLSDTLNTIKNEVELIDIDSNRLYEVALIASNGDNEIAEIVVEAIRVNGVDGSYKIEPSANLESTFNQSKGYKIDRGYVSANFVNNKEKSIVELENVFVLIYKGKLSDVQLVAKLLEDTTRVYKQKMGAQAKLSFLVVADDYAEQVVRLFVTNTMGNNLKIVAIKAPSFGEDRIAKMEDLATIVNGTYIESEGAVRLGTANPVHLGQCDKIEVTRDECLIIEPATNEEDLKMRIETVRNSKDGKDIEDRVNNMKGKVVTLLIGADNPVMLKEKIDRVEDSLKATLTSLRTGIVPGGGSTLVYAFNKLDVKKGSDSFSKGYNLVFNSLVDPMMQLMLNNGYDEFDAFENITEIEGLLGYNAITDEFSDLKAEGIIDPYGVVESTLSNSVNIAFMIMSTDSLIVMKGAESQEINVQDYM